MEPVTFSMYMTKSELVYAISERVKQLKSGDAPKIKNYTGMHITDIAEQEIKKGLCNIKIKRIIPGDKYIEIDSNILVLPYD